MGIVEDRRYVGTGEAARMLGVSDVWVRRLIGAGKLGAVKVAGRVLIERQEVERLAQRQ